MFSDTRDLLSRSFSVKQCNLKHDLENTVIRERGSLESLYFQKKVDAQGCEYVEFVSDIDLMFNAERLDRQSQEALLSMIKRSSDVDPVIRQITSRLTDSQLCQFVKSRYIQSMSELRNWSQSLMQMSDSEISSIRSELQHQYEADVAKRAASQVAQQTAQAVAPAASASSE